MKPFLLHLTISFLAVLMSVGNMQAQTEDVHTIVDRAPKFKGKPSQTEKFFERHMVYPEEARMDMIEGVVEVSFIVTKEGTLVEPNIEKSVDPLLDSEALRLVSLMEEWKPAKKDGEEVNAHVSLPVSFKLSPDERELMQVFKENGLTDKLPLFIMNDKKVKTLVEIPHYNVKSIRVIKGEKAVERYGEEAKNGVVIFKTKRGTPPVR